MTTKPTAPRKPRSPAPGGKPPGPADDLPPLSAAQIREIERRIADHDDRTRYFLASVFTPKFVLYYNVSDDCYGSNPDYATLFKRNRAAAAVQRLLRPHIQLIECRVDKRGKLVAGSYSLRGKGLLSGHRQSRRRKNRAARSRR